MPQVLQALLLVLSELGLPELPQLLLVPLVQLRLLVVEQLPLVERYAEDSVFDVD